MATLAEAVDAAETDWLVSASIPDSVDYLTVESEVVQVTATFPAQYQARDGSTSDPRIRVVRAAGGTTAASHADGTTLTPLIPPSASSGGAAEAGTVVAQNVGTNTTYFGQLFVGDADPADTETTATGDLWIDTTGGVPFSHKERNVTNDGWVLSPMIAKDALGVELASIEVGPTYAAMYATTPGGQAEVHVQDDGRILLSQDGTTTLTLVPGGVVQVNTADGDGRLKIQPDGLIRLENSSFAQVALLANGDVQVAGPNIEFLPDVSLKSNGSIIGTQAAAVADVVDPATATPEDVANTVNALLASLRASAELAT